MASLTVHLTVPYSHLDKGPSLKQHHISYDFLYEFDQKYSVPFLLQEFSFDK